MFFIKLKKSDFSQRCDVGKWDGRGLCQANEPLGSVCWEKCLILKQKLELLYSSTSKQQYSKNDHSCKGRFDSKTKNQFYCEKVQRYFIKSVILLKPIA